MDNLIIEDRSSEFYSDQMPLVSLDNFKTINLFIGANNTRKSRLVRKIASLEKKIIISSSLNFGGTLNALKAALTVLDTMISERDIELIKFRENKNNVDPELRFSRIQDYSRKQTNSSIKLSTFKLQLDNILSSLLSLQIEEDVEKTLDSIRILLSFIEFLVYIYIEAQKGCNVARNVSFSSWSEPNVNAIRFSIDDKSLLNTNGELQRKVNFFIELQNILQQLATIKIRIDASPGIYIPVLRSSRNLLDFNGNVLGNNIFNTTISFQYFQSVNPPNNITINTGQEQYHLIDSARRGKKKQREDFAQFERFIGQSFFQSDNIEIIAHTGSRHPDIIVSLPNELPDIAIHDLGDGVQAIINLFFPVFTAVDNAWVYIDEPELNLHPGFQNLFIRTLLENDFLREKNLKYIINSHSNHILSELLLNGNKQAEIYVFERKDENSSTIKRFEGYEDTTLDVLGVLNTSTLTSNCSVWVEGITDRLYLRASLTAYLNDRQMKFHPIEGLNYSFIEYAGNNLTHFLFDNNGFIEESYEGINAFFINRKIFLIADTDTNKDGKHAKYKALVSSNFQYEETILPEMENLIPRSVLKMYLQQKFKLTGEQSQNLLSKSYDKIKLGKFLAKGLKQLGLNIAIESKTGGTLSSYYKSSLAEFFLQEVQSGTITWSMLKESENLQRIVERLYLFISVANKISID